MSIGKRTLIVGVSVVVAVLAGLVVTYSFHGIAIPSGTRSAQSKVEVVFKDREMHIITDNKRFTVLNFSPHLSFPDPDEKQLLLQESVRIDRKDGFEGQSGRVTVEASEIKLAGLGTTIWKLSEDGDAGQLAEGELGDRFYKVTKFGCCDASDISTYFFLGDGHKVYTAASPIRVVGIPNTGIEFTRYIAYEIVDESRAVLQYGTDREVMQRISIGGASVPSIVFEYQGKSFDGSRLELWGVDGKRDKSALSDFVIRLKYSEGNEIQLPVKNDKIMLNEAQIPAWARVSSM